MAKLRTSEDRIALAPTEMMPVLPPPRAFSALPAMLNGLFSIAAVWLGLALFLIAAAYPLSDHARIALTLLGSSMIAIVIALALSARAEQARPASEPHFTQRNAV